MREILWAAGISSVIMMLSVFAEGVEMSPIATASPIPTATALPSPFPEYENSSIEVGFSQDGEPEPHLYAVFRNGAVLLYQLPEKTKQVDRRQAHAVSPVPSDVTPKPMPAEAYVKRMRQAIDANHFFWGKQPHRKRCKDEYVLRIQFGKKFKERRGCSNQNNDMFAAFAQNIFRDAFLIINKAK